MGRERKKAILALEDGTVFHGISFGAESTQTGEICFNTSMTGYQEILTDPSYRGQIVTMTCPLIGNYGVSKADAESGSVHVRGFVIEELCDIPSNWRSEMPLHEYLVAAGVPGIEGIDTRALTKRLRVAGAMRATLCTDGSLDADAAVAAAQQSESMEGSDFVKEVTTLESYLWDPQGVESRRWTIVNPTLDDPLEETDGQQYHPICDPKYRIVAYDFGIKRNILRSLRQQGFEVEVVNSRTPASEVLARNPDGIFLSNGPGDPAALDYIHTEIKQFVGKKPIFGICLGHQILAHSFGGTTFKLKFGHRGGNHPVKDLRSGKIAITSQNHGFAADGDTLPAHVEVTHLNLNDGTVEGMRHRDYPVFSVQYHPEAAPGPNDASYFFEEFANLIDQSR
ncbi:MAG: glutamine-hydrolyzing carbamoyl-phosphate synthase small subunit [Verrucomicrobiales bacterium]|jgi:carbamoyl-phosphate synthase small subunit|nr:glutamine-hydrolyzing carbamoyl-phosphate synthase small subunit [Verrucomicrobiales bacterium]MBP9222221.1 glutamine-hydrolyzing carbamoyl-phosphate synthase small subunit [Verrucomicrobiales bacterium]HQZ27300.1 glutamine-hydrolyzing carbamoyl-phosphate synthase small subunit [Verrucomicrobiales bacterium]